MRLENEFTYVDGAKVSSCSMPNRKDHPPPEHLEVEVGSFLPCGIYLWVLVDILIIDILTNIESKIDNKD